MKRKILSYLLVVSMMSTMFAGCGKEAEPEANTSSNEPVKTEEAVKTDDSKVISSSVDTSSNAGAKINLISTIENNFASAQLDEDYNKGVYSLPEDYIFSFPCSKEAGNIAYEAFAVYATTDYEPSFHNYGVSTYQDGYITVAPSGTVRFDEACARNTDDGTWGSFNQMYLVQFIDLETGKTLEKPLVTPFTVKHALKAPLVSQNIDENNNYYLSWKPVDGAVKYVVYEYFGGDAFAFTKECSTSNTSVSVNEFDSQIKDDTYDNLIKQDLANEGYQVNMDGKSMVNSCLKYSDDLKDGYYVVVAFDANGKSSGISNIVDVRDMASILPVRVHEQKVEVTISSVMDIPAYVDVEMVDGSIAKMVIDYHGAQTYIYEDDELKMSIKAKVANTDLDNFMVVLHGMTYEDVMKDVSYISEREDEILSTASTPVPSNCPVDVTDDDTAIIDADIEMPELPADEDEPDVITESTPQQEIEESQQEIEESQQSSASQQPDDSDVPADDIPMQLFDQVAEVVGNNITLLGVDTVNSVLYARSSLEAWMAYCMIAQSDVIPMPISEFPEAANLEYAAELFLECYRQNPSCGIIDIESVAYNYQYECFCFDYVEDSEQRFTKTEKELAKAYEIASTQCNDSMSDYEKVYALNEYFRLNCEYDFDSAETDIEDVYAISEAFMDAHTPYGILCNNYGVCESYSEAFALTARMAGLEAIMEIGTLYGGGHEWNRVKIDGDWCVLDVTNNDREDAINGLMNVSEEQIAGILVPQQQAICDTQEVYAAVDTNEYYYMNGMSFGSMEEARTAVVNELKSNDSVAVRVPPLTEDEFIEWLKVLVYEDNLDLVGAVLVFNVIYLEVE